ncbi:DegT/DnrJ/EryC1/StrS family aminotransferase [Nitrincola schmidtii]|uniref:DegT/DnrJ/EryC1/StrS family aminotransferase n=1 Tax=Nitrincola schmidtii TaxID=1730894 RepID=UPI00124E6CB7|nr:DegT/DnrJ/EryC1/StrS family aminotransferase [Nitrincola schmidtii]
MTQDSFLPFSRPEISEEEIAEVVDTLRSGWVTTGPKAKQFEQDFSHYLTGNESDASIYSVAVNSATAGLHLALEALGIGPGDEVIIPTYTFTATAEVVRYMGATPVLVDIQPDTFNIDPIAIEAAITPSTRMIIPVHFAGLACDMGQILQLAEKYQLRVVEDAAHALPTTWAGKKVGTLGSDACVFSFYANKTMTTGEGGMLVTRHSRIAERAKVMRLHGISKDIFDRYQSNKPNWFYEVIAPGFKYNLTDIAAAIGIQQLKKIDQFHLARERLAQEYNQLLKDLPLRLPTDAPSGDLQARHLYPIRLLDQSAITRDRFIERMAEAGVGCSVHFIPLHLHPYWQSCCHVTPANFPIAQAAFEQEVSLPLFPSMQSEDVVRVVEALKRVLAQE